MSSDDVDYVRADEDGVEPTVTSDRVREHRGGAYRCDGCDERFPRDEFMTPGEALGAARDHAVECGGDVRFDPGLDVDDYDVGFEERDVR